MDKKLIEETAKELDLTPEEVEEVIRSMETLIHKSITESTLDDLKEVRVMGFGTFATVSDKALQKLKSNTYEKERKTS